MIYFATNFVGNTYDLEYPRILWNSASRRGTVAASTEETGYEAVLAATETQFDVWKPTALPATWTLTFDTSESVSAVGIDSHTLGTSSATITIQGWNGSSWDDIVSASPTDDTSIAFLFTSENRDRLRISLTGSTAPSIGIIHICEALELPQRVYQEAPTPIDMGLKTEFNLNASVGGNFLGRTIKRQKNVNTFSVSHLTEAYVRSTLMPFIEDALEYPYFLLERPYTRPTALSYRWQGGDITPVKMGIRNYMRVDL